MCTQPRKGLLAQCWSGIWVSLLTGFMATDPLFKAGIKEKNMKKKKKGNHLYKITAKILPKSLKRIQKKGVSRSVIITIFNCYKVLIQKMRNDT